MRSVLIAFAAGLLSAALFFSLNPLAQPVNALSVTPIFSPGAESQFVSFIESSEISLDVMLYQFSNPALQDALARAAARGVAVRVILEPRVDSNYATAEFLASNGVEVRWASREYTNTHSKTAVSDSKRMLVGSTNWSRQAMVSNRETAVVIESEGLAAEFLGVFELDWSKAKQFVR